ncbi:MAG: flippase [bacterium]|nr:flippase [bacterium]
MSVFRVVVRNTLAQGFGKVITLILGLGTTAMLTRMFGPRGYGEYTFIISFVLLFGTMADWGTQLIAVREASQNKERRPVIFGSAILFRLLLAIAASIFLNAVIRLNASWGAFVFSVTTASFILLALSLKTSAIIIFQTLLRFEKAALVEIFSSILFLALVALAFIQGSNLSGVIIFWLISTILASLLALLLATKTTHITWVLDKGVIRRVFWEAAPTGALLLVSNLYNRVDIVILQHFQGEVAVGIYGLPYKIHDHLVMGAAFLMNSMFPLLSQKFSEGAKGHKSLVSYYQQTFDILLVSATLLLIVVFLAAPLIVNILAGSAFSESGLALRILVFGTFIAYFNHLTGYSIIAFGKQKSALLIAAAALIFNVLGNWIFIPLYSFKAAAVITIATEGLVLIFSTIVIYRTIGIIPRVHSFPKTVRSFFRGGIFK